MTEADGLRNIIDTALDEHNRSLAGLTSFQEHIEKAARQINFAVEGTTNQDGISAFGILFSIQNDIMDMRAKMLELEEKLLAFRRSP